MLLEATKPFHPRLPIAARYQYPSIHIPVIRFGFPGGQLEDIILEVLHNDVLRL